uniref:RING-type domain-containing protein n=1 Tax=Panagrellus redivivus TaxID=6233 RepID=A0A7E4VSB2_PANRE
MCHETNTWRLYLRNCKHIVCVSCGLEYIRHWIQDRQKARIKCPKKSCKRRIYPSDIDALLNPQNPDLDHFMPLSSREWLQYHHDRDVISYGLGGDGMAQQCPLCKNMYAKMDGCNYVRCSNLRCNQWFCFICGDPVASFQHFTKNQCKVGWDDVYKLTYFLRFVLMSQTMTNCLIMPFVSLSILVGIPLGTVIAFPYFIFKSLERCAIQKGSSILRVYFIMAALTPVILPFSLILGIGSIFTVLPILFAYLVLSAVKCFPVVGQFMKILDYLSTALGVAGFGDWKTILRDAKAARLELEAEERQKILEKTEYITTADRNTQERKYYDIIAEEHEYRENRAIGAAQCEDGAVDVGRFIKKGAHNIDAIKEGNVRELQGISREDVIVNDMGEVVGNIPKGGKKAKMFQAGAGLL